MQNAINAKPDTENRAGAAFKNDSRNIVSVVYLPETKRKSDFVRASFTMFDPEIKRAPVERNFLLSDLGALIASFVCGGALAAFIDRTLFQAPIIGLLSYASLGEFAAFAAVGLLALLWLDTKGHYLQRLPYWETTSHIATIAAIGLLTGGFIQFSAKAEYSRLWLALSWICFAIFIYAGRRLTRRWLEKSGKWTISALLIGEGPAAAAAIKALRSEKHMGYEIVDTRPVSTLEALTEHGSWSRLLKQAGANHLLLALPGSETETHQAALQTLIYEKVPYSIIPTWFSLPTSTLSSHYFFTQGVTVMHNTNRLHLMLPRMIKRGFDVAAAGLVIIAISPLMIVLALLVRTDGGKALFRHKRLGQHGKSFACLKFRSMMTNSDEVLARHLAENPEAHAEWEREHKLRDDPRVTKIGRFLRATSLDELPQLFNVLKGDMSLVGPRPIVAAECSKYQSDIALYYMVRPGLTGLWQVSGRNDVSYARRIEMDSMYVRNWSFWHDIAIIFQTVPALLKRTGAY